MPFFLVVGRSEDGSRRKGVFAGCSALQRITPLKGPDTHSAKSEKRNAMAETSGFRRRLIVRDNRYSDNNKDELSTSGDKVVYGAQGWGVMLKPVTLEVYLLNFVSL